MTGYFVHVAACMQLRLTLSNKEGKERLRKQRRLIKIRLTDGSGKTPQSFKNSLTALFSGFPDLYVNIEHILAEITLF
jgi:hypothetical protein